MQISITWYEKNTLRAHDNKTHGRIRILLITTSLWRKKSFRGKTLHNLIFAAYKHIPVAISYIVFRRKNIHQMVVLNHDRPTYRTSRSYGNSSASDMADHSQLLSIGRKIAMNSIIRLGRGNICSLPRLPCLFTYFRVGWIDGILNYVIHNMRLYM